MKDVDYISGVSGGTYAATAFASHVVAAGSPAGENLDRWYLQIMARMSLGDAVLSCGAAGWSGHDDDSAAR